ncbi:secreted protein [Beggiatoa sp. PS]|nr:secreted protein [Beggiatoa sp. PS]
MKKSFLPTILLIGFIFSINTAQAVGPAIAVVAWDVVKALAIDTAMDAVQDLFKDRVEPTEVDALRQRIAELEQQLVVVQNQRNYPSMAEFEAVQQIVTSLGNMVETLDTRLDSVEQRLGALEQHVAALRQPLLVLPRENKTGPTIIKTEPLDFKINYVYRSGGKGPFKPLTDGGVLHSGDYYKILFTPIEDCYVFIFQMDSANKLFRLFPIQGFDNVTVNHVNPVTAGQTYYIPSKHQSFELDEQTGPETIYFVATRQDDVILEKHYQAMQLSEQQHNIAKQQQIQGQLVNTLRESKGPKQRLQDDVDGIKTTWQEDGQAFSVLQQTLQDMCNGCVDILTFEHQ